MGDIKGFLKVKRGVAKRRPVEKRIKDYKEIPILRSAKTSQEQGSRCMDCGTPFCQWGCSVANIIPEWNDLIYRGQWERAVDLLQSTNNFPEITGRVCPALCEYACVLGINDEPITIRENELAIIEYAFKKGIIKPNPPKKRTGKKVAVIGSGPAGLACAAQLNKTGHKVTVFEKDDRMGGILRYGIPDFKLGKGIIDRRLNILKKEGIVFRVNVNVDGNYLKKKLKDKFNAICLATGSREPRDLLIEGRGFEGIYFAMDYLIQSNKEIAGEKIDPKIGIDAKGKHVVVIGGGDTGSDCIGTAHRQGAVSVTQMEILPRPPESRTSDMPWPTFPNILKTSTSHEEGGDRKWSIQTKKFIGKDGKVRKMLCEQEGEKFEIDADLVILAMGFIHPEHKGLLKDLKFEFDHRGNIKTDQNHMTSHKGIFSAGDCHRGASLVAWAILEGRSSARCVDTYLMGKSSLPEI